MILTVTIKEKHLIVAFLLVIVVSLIFTKSGLFRPGKPYMFLPTSPWLSSRTTVHSLCEPERPCQYSDQVHLRIIVLTLNRSSSLLKLLDSLNELELDSQSAALEIFIDRDRKTRRVDELTVNVASEFQWSRGPSRVHVQKTHVGLYGQWINTWRPAGDSNDEIGLILEDDLIVSKYAYRWISAVFRAFGNRTDFAGASLAGYQWPYLSTSPQKGEMTGPKNHTVVMQKCFGWWGFAPKPMHWRLFQVNHTFLKASVLFCRAAGLIALTRRLTRLSINRVKIFNHALIVNFSASRFSL